MRRSIWLSLLTITVLALPVGGVGLVVVDSAIAKKHHKKHHKKKKKKGICGGLAVGGTNPDTSTTTGRSTVQFGCTVTFSTFTVTTNHTMVTKMIGSETLPLVLYTGGQTGCTLNGPHSFTCTVPPQVRGKEVKAFFAESQGCTGLKVTVTVNGKASKIPVNAACK